MSETLQKPAEARPIAADKTIHCAQLALWQRPDMDDIEIHQESQT